MNTAQNSWRKQSAATPQTALTEASTSTTDKPVAKQLYFGDLSTVEGSHTVTDFNEFGAMMTNPKAMNELRQDLRAWFMAYIPGWETSFSQNNLEESIRHYEALDNFLGMLIQEGISQLKGGEAR